MIMAMSQPGDNFGNRIPNQEPLSVWKSIILLIILVFGAVSLFGVIVYLFISGAQRMGWPPAAHIVIFVIISGIFAWLVKRITDIVSGMSQRWFPEEISDNDGPDDSYPAAGDNQ